MLMSNLCHPVRTLMIPGMRLGSSPTSEVTYLWFRAGETENPEFQVHEGLRLQQPPPSHRWSTVGCEVNALRQKSQHRSQCSISFSWTLHSLIITSTLKIEHFINYLEISQCIKCILLIFDPSTAHISS